LSQTMGKLNELVGGTVSRDDLRQYWVEMAAKLSKQQELVVSEREQLRQDLAARLDQIGAEREHLRVEVGERLARVAEAEALRNQLAGTVSRLERALLHRVEQDTDRWEEQLETALEAVRLAVDGIELNRQAMLAEVSAAVRAALGSFLPPLSR